MLVFIFIIGVLLGMAISAGVIQFSSKPALKTKTKKAIPATASAPETRGYAFNSFDYVSKRLPPAPPGYMWEHKITTAEDGEIWHHLGVMRVLDEKVLKSAKVSLTYCYHRNSTRRWMTWTEHARTYGNIHKEECAENSYRLVQFAQKIVDNPKINPDAAIDKYELKA